MNEPLADIGSAELIARLREIGNSRKYDSGAPIFSQGETPEFFPIVLSGRVKIYRFLSPGKEVIMNVFGAGEAFAIPPVLDGTKYPANAVAIEDSKLLLIYRRDFLALLDESQEFSKFVMTRMSGLLRETTRAIKNLATASPEERLASILVWLAEKEDSKPPVTISIRRQDIAQIAGLATETTIRAIRKLADDGLISIVRGKIVIENPELLRSAADQ